MGLMGRDGGLLGTCRRLGFDRGRSLPKKCRSSTFPSLLFPEFFSGVSLVFSAVSVAIIQCRQKSVQHEPQNSNPLAWPWRRRSAHAPLSDPDLPQILLISDCVQKGTTLRQVKLATSLAQLGEKPCYAVVRAPSSLALHFTGPAKLD